MDSKQTLLEQYLTEYTPENRLGFCRLVRTKYRFEKYKLSSKFEDVDPEDFIVQDSNTLAKADKALQNGSCSKEEFIEIFNELDMDQIEYIGF